MAEVPTMHIFLKLIISMILIKRNIQARTFVHTSKRLVRRNPMLGREDFKKDMSALIQHKKSIKLLFFRANHGIFRAKVRTFTFRGNQN